MILDLYSLFRYISLHANRISPDWMSRFAASHLGLFCLPMSHKQDARHKQVKKTIAYLLTGCVEILVRSN